MGISNEVPISISYFKEMVYLPQRNTRIFGYARVSSQEQNLDRQIESLKQYVEVENILTDKASGKNVYRPAYQALKGVLGLREGDVLYVTSLDRLSRNKEDINVVIWTNIFTNPVVVYLANCVKLLNNNLIYNIIVIIMEIIVVIVEFIIYKKYLNFKEKSPVFISIINNIISFSAGIIISKIIF